MVQAEAGVRVGERFEVLETLGQGAFGTTYRARDLTKGGEVALKVLRMERLESWKALELFEREATVLEELDHRAIPRYVAHGEIGERGQAYLAQTLAPGVSLGALLREGRRLDEAEAIRVAERLLEVLVYLQARRPPVVHRDIKPDNILMDGQALYLVDFGSVTRALAGDAGSTVAGTFGYMAPEQLRGAASGASDVFGLGMTLVHLVTGVSPERLEQQRGRPDFRSRAELREGVARWLDQMTAPIVEDRFGSAAQALLKLRALTSSEARAALERPLPGGAMSHWPEDGLKNRAILKAQRPGRGLSIVSDPEAGSLALSYRPPLGRLLRDYGVGMVLLEWALLLMLGTLGSWILWTAMGGVSDPGNRAMMGVVGGLCLAPIPWWLRFMWQRYAPGLVRRRLWVEEGRFWLQEGLRRRGAIRGKLEDLRVSFDEGRGEVVLSRFMETSTLRYLSEEEVSELHVHLVEGIGVREVAVAPEH